MKKVFTIIIVLGLSAMAYGQGPYTADNDRSFTWPSGDLPDDICLSGPCDNNCTIVQPVFDFIRREYEYERTMESVSSSFVGSRTSRVNLFDRAYAAPTQGISFCIIISETSGIHDSNFTTVNFVNFEATDLTHSFCAGGSVNLRNFLTYTNGVTWSGGANSNGVFSTNTPGTYNPVATRIFDNGTSTITFTVTVNALPNMTFSAISNRCTDSNDVNLFDHTNIDAGSFSSAAAIIGGNFVDVSATSTGINHTITQTYTNSNGCTNTASSSIRVEQDIVIDAGANQEACNGSGNVSLTAATSGVSWSCVGCPYVSSSNFNTNSAPPGIYTVRASKTVGACSDTDDKIFTVKALPIVEAGSNLTLCVDAGSITLTGHSPTGGSYSGVVGLAGNVLNVATAGVGTHTVIYTFTNSQGCTQSDSRTIIINGLPDETAIDTNSPVRCGSGEVEFTASLSGNTIRWYTSSTGGTPINTGNSYTTTIPIGTTTFYAEAVNSNNCVSNGRKLINGTANEVPLNPTAPGVDRCGPGAVTLTVSGGIGNTSYRWYENFTGGGPIATGVTFETPSLSSSRAYYVDAISEQGCVSMGRTQTEVVINSIPGMPTIFSNSRCGPGVVNLSAGGTPLDGEYRWYNEEIGGSSFNTTNTFSPDISTTTSYWVSIVTVEGCEGPRAEVIGTIFPDPSQPQGLGDSRCGPGIVNLTVSGINGNIFNWYDTEFSQVSLQEGNVFSPTESVSRSYWAEMTDNNGCISPRTEVPIIIHPIPADPIAGSQGICGPGEVVLNASGSGAGVIYNWYENPTGGSSLFNGPSFTTPSLTSSKSYYVQATSDPGCLSANRTEVLAEIQPIPSAPIVFNNFSCGPGIVSLTVAGASVDGEYRWYTNESGGTSFNNTNAFDANIAITESYWVSVISPAGCEGPRAEIVADIFQVPLAPLGVDDQRCGPGSMVLSASSEIGGTFNWYATEFSQTSIFNGPVFNTPNLDNTISYWVDITDSNGCMSQRTKIQAIVDPVPPDPTSQNVSSCGPGMVTLNASGSGLGTTYKWYDNATGGTSVFVGESYQTMVSTSRNFYVEAESPEGCISTNRTQVAATINPLPAEPLVFDDESCGEGIVTLTVAGAPAGGEYGWYNSESGGMSFNSTNTFTTSIVATTSYWVSVITPELCEGPREEIMAILNLPPDAPTGFNNSRCGTGPVILSASSPITGTFNWYETEASQVSVLTGINFITPEISETSSFWVDITDENGCTSPRTETVAVVDEIPADAIVPNVSRCGPGEVTIIANGSVEDAIYQWFENPTGGLPVNTGEIFTTSVTASRNYYVAAVSPDNCVSLSRMPVTVSVNSFPGLPTTFDGSSCGSGVVSLAVGGAPAGGNYGWYTSATSGMSFNSTATYEADITQTETYWVSIVTAEGCEGGRSAITAEIFDIPTAPIGNGSSRCGAGTVTISASSSESGTFRWYETKVSPVTIFNGVNFTTPPLSVSTSYWVEFVDSDGCISPRTEVVAEVLSVISDPTVPAVERCGAGEVTITASSNTVGATFEWYDNPFGGASFFVGPNYVTTLGLSDVFYVVAISPEGCESVNRTPVNVTINPLPSSPNVQSGGVCGTGEVVLAATGAPQGGTYNWYESGSGTDVVATGSTFTTPILALSRSFYVSIVNEQGCEGNRSKASAMVNVFPDRPLVDDVSRCGGGDVVLAANTPLPGATINWYLNHSGGAPFAAGGTITINDLDETTTYYATVLSQEGCESGREEVTAVIDLIIPVNIGDNIPMCINAGPYDLTRDLTNATASDGFFIGPGVIGTNFHPDIAGLGNHEITFLLQTEIGCLENGSRFITVIDTKENGEGLAFERDEVTHCISGGFFDLKNLVNLPSGIWTLNALEGSINVGVVDPMIAGVGEFVATYEVEVNGCTVIGEIAFNIVATPDQPMVIAPAKMCSGETIEIEATGGTPDITYTWFSDDTEASFATGKTVELFPDSTKTYWVEAKNAFGCLSKQTEFTIQVEDIILDFTATPLTIETGGRVEFVTDVMAAEYLWDFGDDLTSTEQNPAHIYFEEGLFAVGLEVITEEGCKAQLVKEDLIEVNSAGGEGLITSVDNDVKAQNTYAYPLPFRNGFMLKLWSKLSEGIQLTLYNLSGEPLLETSVSLSPGENDIAVSTTHLSLSNGLYLLHLSKQDGSSSYLKLLKE